MLPFSWSFWDSDNADLVWEPGLFPGDKYQVTKSVGKENVWS